jgi:hypothetical protein
MLACKLNVMAKLRMVGRGHVAHEQPGRNQSQKLTFFNCGFHGQLGPVVHASGPLFICVRRNPGRLISCEQFGCRAPPRLILGIDIGERLLARVADGEATFGIVAIRPE